MNIKGNGESRCFPNENSKKKKNLECQTNIATLAKQCLTGYHNGYGTLNPVTTNRNMTSLSYYCFL